MRQPKYRDMTDCQIAAALAAAPRPPSPVQTMAEICGLIRRAASADGLRARHDGRVDDLMASAEDDDDLDDAMARRLGAAAVPTVTDDDRRSDFSF